MTAILPETPTSAPPAFDPTTFDPHAPSFCVNPYPTFAWFRKNAPVYFVKQYNSYWVFRFDDVKRVLSDSEDFSSLNFTKHRYDKPEDPRPGAFSVLGNLPDGMFMMDPPRHGEVRKPMDAYLRESAKDAPQLASAIGKKILKGLRGSRRLELMGTYAFGLPSSVLLTVMGIPQGDWPTILQWVSAIEMAHDITQTAAVQGMGGTCAMALGNYFQALAHGTATKGCPFHAEPGRVFDSMAKNIGEKPAMSALEVQQTGINLAVAGFLSTTFLIGSGMLNLLGGLEHAAERRTSGRPIDLLRKRPELMTPAVNEMLRYDSPFQLVDRFVVNHDTELGGTKLTVGDIVSVVITSAHRDESAFPNADVFDITRYAPGNTATPHLGFGTGIHTCYGGPLVDLVAPVAFANLLEEFSEIQLAGAVQWKTDPYLRSPSNLPLEVTPSS